MSQEPTRAVEPEAASPPDVQVTYDVKITPRLVMAIVGPYVAEKFMEQVKALAPVSLFSSQWQYLHSTLSYFGSAAFVLAATVFILYSFWRIKRFNFWTFRFQFARIPFKRLP